MSLRVRTTVAFGRGALRIKPGEWQTVVVEILGDEMVTKTIDIMGQLRPAWYHCDMPMTDAQQKALVRQWIAAAPALRKARHADIRRQNNARVIYSLEELSRYALKRARPRIPWGLVQMYKILSRATHR